MHRTNAALNGEWAQHVRPFTKRQTSKARRRDARARRSVLPSVSDWEDGTIVYGTEFSNVRNPLYFFCECCRDAGYPCCCGPEVDAHPHFAVGDVVGILGSKDTVIGYGTIESKPSNYREEMNPDGNMEWIVYGDYEVKPMRHVRGRPMERYSPWRLKKLGLLETLAAVSL